MLYQKLLMGNKPYFIRVGNAAAFETHRHPEIEISFCMSGEYDVVCENKRYSLKTGDLAVIPPMTAHEIPPDNNSCKSLTVEVGYTLLGSFFNAFTNLNTDCIFYKKSELQHSAQYAQLSKLLEETAYLNSSDSDFCALSVKGNLYKISALLLQMLNEPESALGKSGKSKDIKKIDKALDIIYSRYFEPLDIKEISALCGYSESNFCKIFKNITGDTFHRTLNRHRIEIACILLRETDYAVERIAQETGFADSKSFCRVFKSFMNVNAGAYRKL